MEQLSDDNEVMTVMIALSVYDSFLREAIDIGMVDGDDQEPELARIRRLHLYYDKLWDEVS